ADDRVQSDGQLTLYQLACERLLGAEVARLAFYHLPSLTEQSVPRHDEDLVDGLRRKIVTTAEAIVAAQFEPKPEEKKCHWCDYKPICPVFKHQFSAAQQDLVFSRAAPSEPDEELAALVDQVGELESRAVAIDEELAAAKERLAELLKKRGYSRAFGKRF